MIKMAAKSIFLKTLKLFFTGRRGRISKIAGMWHLGICPIIVCSKYDYGLTLTCFMAMSFFLNQALLKKSENSCFLKIKIKTYCSL